MENNISLWDKLPTEIQDYIINIKKQNKERDYKEECNRLYEKYKDFDNHDFELFYEIKINYCGSHWIKYIIGYILEKKHFLNMKLNVL